ncbi:MAG: ketoacyl-ACP synthase III [Acidobacteria bacterium]|jgi:3-oxoacyl-[acyl-carrier-protein] synthase-3|nr:ketoacyl-ACP synthase III [Acidobacteriota bacterium]
MEKKVYSVIVGTGSYVPARRVLNSDFLGRTFFDAKGDKLKKSNEETIGKLSEITGIKERRHAADDQLASDLAYLAAEDALTSSGIDRESLDYIIVAHNFGDVRFGNVRSDFVPSLAARVKHKLAIANPGTVAYDLPFGCPGWVQGVIQADYYIRSGDCRRVMVIGAETLSRISDPHDRDSMIYADGGGAVILEAVASDRPQGVLSHAARSDTLEHAYMLWMGRSFDPAHQGDELYLKMDGHKLYEYALKTVPLVAKESVEKAGLGIGDIKKVLIHQANEKMDEAILKRLFKICGGEYKPAVMPMIISWLGNSSVATVPTLLDLLLKGKLADHALASGDNIVLTSVGAGMNINAVVYRLP